MNEHLEPLMAKLEGYRQSAQAQIRIGGEQTSYWRGVLFGLELTLLEMRKEQAFLDNRDDIYERISDLISNTFEDLITLYQTPIPRDLLIYNVQRIGADLQSAIRAYRNNGSETDS